MFNKILMFFILFSFSVKAQVLSGHQEFVHYTDEQKNEFIIKVMELMVELEDQYEKAPANEKLKYTLLLKELKELLISSAYAAETDPTIFAKDITTLLDPNITNNKRCIYAGWASLTIATVDHKSGTREICQHPKYISNFKNSPEARAYNKSSPCGKNSRNMISCNPAIFGFKNKEQGSQFCVKAGPEHAENSSYACMQLALGESKDKNTDSREKRLDYLKKQFEGDPALVNNLYGFVYKTCLCDTQEKKVINQSYLNRIRPHRTCLALVNTVTETKHCVDFGTMKSTEMELFKGIQTFTNGIATNAKGTQIDSEYRKLLGSVKDRFSNDYANICGGDQKIDEQPPIQPNNEGKECIGICEKKDGKFVDCTFTSEGQPIEVTPPEDTGSEFTTTIGEEKYRCTLKEKPIDHKTSCHLVVTEDKVSFKLEHPEDIKPEVKATIWSPSQEGSITEQVSFGKEESVSLSIDIEVNGQTDNVECGSANNPKKEGNENLPKVEIKKDGEDDTTQKFDTITTPKDPEGWTYEWSRTTLPKEETPKPPVHGDSNDEAPQDDTPKEDKREFNPLDGNGKTFDAPKEDKTYQVCVQLVKGDKKTDRDCASVDQKSKKDDAASSTKPTIGGPQLPQMPQPMRRGVDFSRGGVL